MSVYNLSLPASMKDVHQVFHVSLSREQKHNLIVEKRQPEPAHVTVKCKDKGEVKDIMTANKIQPPQITSQQETFR